MAHNRFSDLSTQDLIDLNLVNDTDFSDDVDEDEDEDDRRRLTGASTGASSVITGATGSSEPTGSGITGSGITGDSATGASVTGGHPTELDNREFMPPVRN